MLIFKTNRRKIYSLESYKIESNPTRLKIEVFREAYNKYLEGKALNAYLYRERGYLNE